MTGYDIRHAMEKAYGISTLSGGNLTYSFDEPQRVSWVHRLIVAVSKTVKGWVL
jgi:hypothetical protein